MRSSNCKTPNQVSQSGCFNQNNWGPSKPIRNQKPHKEKTWNILKKNMYIYIYNKKQNDKIHMISSRCCSFWRNNLPLKQNGKLCVRFCLVIHQLLTLNHLLEFDYGLLNSGFSMLFSASLLFRMVWVGLLLIKSVNNIKPFVWQRNFSDSSDQLENGEETNEWTWITNPQTNDLKPRGTPKLHGQDSNNKFLAICTSTGSIGVWCVRITSQNNRLHGHIPTSILQEYTTMPTVPLTSKCHPGALPKIATVSIL